MVLLEASLTADSGLKSTGQWKRPEKRRIISSVRTPFFLRATTTVLLFYREIDVKSIDKRPTLPYPPALPRRATSPIK
jgi:hypothetical protein